MYNSIILDNKAGFKILSWTTNKAVAKVKDLFFLPITLVPLIAGILEVRILLFFMVLSISKQLNKIGQYMDTCDEKELPELQGFLSEISDGLESILSFSSETRRLRKLVFSTQLLAKVEILKQKCDDYIEVLEISLSPKMHSLIEEAINALPTEHGV